jgi:lysophospholipase L1-like esterase
VANLKVKNLVCDGNSITAGLINDGGGSAAQNSWPVVCRNLLIADANATKAWRVANLAQAGNTTADRITKWTDLGGVKSQMMPQCGLNVLTFFEGTNDFITGGLSVATVIAQTTTYAERAIREGWYLQLITVPNTTNTSAQPKVAEFNEWLLTSRTARRLSTLPCINITSALGNPAGSNYQTDGVHPNQTGYGIIAALVKARVAAL